MAQEAITIARPYAKAAFACSVEANKMAEWAAMLELAAGVVRDDQVRGLLDHPAVLPNELAALVTDMCEKSLPALDDTQKQFISVLADAKRLRVLPQIATRFEKLKRDREQVAEALVKVFRMPTDDQKARLQKALSKRLGVDVQCTYEVDESLLGGALVQTGNVVIDFSVRKQLQRLHATLVA